MVDRIRAELDQSLRRANKAGQRRMAGQPRALSARYDARKTRLVIELTNGAIMMLPPKLLQGLENASPSQLSKVQISLRLRTPLGIAGRRPECRRSRRRGLRLQGLDERTRATCRVPDIRKKVGDFKGKRQTRRPPPISAINLTRPAAGLAADLCQFARVQPETPALRALVDLYRDRARERAAQHHGSCMARAAQPGCVIDECCANLAKVGHERVAEHAVRILEPGQLEPVEPESSAMFADVGADAADSKPGQRCRAARAIERVGGHAV
jgi:hypothetical protein